MVLRNLQRRCSSVPDEPPRLDELLLVAMLRSLRAMAGPASRRVSSAPNGHGLGAARAPFAARAVFESLEMRQGFRGCRQRAPRTRPADPGPVATHAILAWSKQSTLGDRLDSASRIHDERTGWPRRQVYDEYRCASSGGNHPDTPRHVRDQTGRSYTAATRVAIRDLAAASGFGAKSVVWASKMKSGSRSDRKSAAPDREHGRGLHQEAIAGGAARGGLWAADRGRRSEPLDRAVRGP